MSKTLKISKDQMYNMERKARRDAQIACGVPYFKHKAHKTAKDYNRKEAKRVDMD
jgi:hypothetical protein